MKPDTIKLQVVWTGPGAYHSSLRITPDNQERWSKDPRFASHEQRDANGRLTLTLGAGPQSVLRVATSRSTPMISAFNRLGDTGPQTASYAISPGVQGEDAAIDRLLTADAHYNDNLPYELFPHPLSGGYNSNGYVSGILAMGGMYLGMCIPYDLPGYDKSVSPWDFR